MLVYVFVCVVLFVSIKDINRKGEYRSLAFQIWSILKELSSWKFIVHYLFISLNTLKKFIFKVCIWGTVVYAVTHLQPYISEQNGNWLLRNSVFTGRILVFISENWWSWCCTIIGSEAGSEASAEAAIFPFPFGIFK